jgi:predicted AlkP superfamily pyrophosphatase or phosphodiesterase
LTLYFLGLDSYSHRHGPDEQGSYIASVVDPLVGRLWQTLEELNLLDGTLFGIVSDHGQVPVIKDDRHSLRLSFPFDREMGYLFDTLGLDVHDLPGEGPNTNAVVGSNGGLALVYVQNRRGHWADPPSFIQDVLPVAGPFGTPTSPGGTPAT